MLNSLHQFPISTYQLFSYTSLSGLIVVHTDGKLLTIDSTCSIEIQSFMEQGCQSVTLLAPAVGGGVAAVVIITVVAVILVVSVMVARNCHR